MGLLRALGGVQGSLGWALTPSVLLHLRGSLASALALSLLPTNFLQSFSPFNSFLQSPTHSKKEVCTLCLCFLASHSLPNSISVASGFLTLQTQLAKSAEASPTSQPQPFGGKLALQPPRLQESLFPGSSRPACPTSPPRACLPPSTRKGQCSDTSFLCTLSTRVI